MESNIIFIILFALFIISIIFVFYLCRRRHKRPGKELDFADINDPYDRPFILKQLLTPQQIKQIMDYSRNKLVDSEVVGGKIKSIRNSQQTWIEKTNPLVKPLFEKVSNMFQIPVENAEALQVVRYRPNQYYNEHHDSCCDDNEHCKEFIKNGGQRKLTVLIYLNDAFEGGHTYFKNLDLKVKCTPGDAVVFYPLAKGTCKCHPLALHAGMPVEKGEKWVANLWFREREFIN